MPRKCKLLVISALASVSIPLEAVAASFVAPTGYFSQATTFINGTALGQDTGQIGSTSASASSLGGAVTATADRATGELHAYTICGTCFSGASATATFGDTLHFINPVASAVTTTIVNFSVTVTGTINADSYGPTFILDVGASVVNGGFAPTAYSATVHASLCGA
jgi:hypothetical protein